MHEIFLLEKRFKLKKESLKELDKRGKLIPLTFDPIFKSLFISNKNLLEKLIISALHLENIEEGNMTFASNELIKENYKEYNKTIDMHTIIEDDFHVIVEVNTENFADVKLRNFLYQTKLYSTLLESGKKTKDLKNKYLFQLNLNTRGKNNGIPGETIVFYSKEKQKTYLKNFVAVIKYLEVYRKLYYNGNRNKEVSWMTLLTAKTNEEVYEILGNIVTDEERDKFLKDVIRLNKDEFILHEWEKDKLDELVEYEKTERVSKESFANGFEDGFENGEKSGLENGISLRNLEIARNMINEKIDIKTIAKVTGLSKEEINALK